MPTKQKKKWTHSELCDIAVKFLKRSGNGLKCQIAVSEMQTSYYSGEQVDAFGYRCIEPHRGSYMIEVKVSRSDFLADGKKPHRMDPAKGVGKYRAYMCPEGIIQPEEIPHGWDLFWVNDRGHVSIKKKDFIECPVRNIDGELYLMARLIQRVSDPEKLNQILKESSRLSSRAWAEVDSLIEENKKLRHQNYELKEKMGFLI